MELEKEMTKQEITILIDAIDAWVDKDFGSQILGDMLEHVLMNKDAHPDEKAKFAEKRRKEGEERKASKQMRKEQGIMLKAKLLKIRDSIEAASIY